jgi:hypothetical protein
MNNPSQNMETRESIGKSLERLSKKNKKGLCQFKKENGFICCKESVNKFVLRCKEHYKMQVTTLSGRRIDAPPQIRLDSNRKTIIDLKKQQQWLLDEAYTEAFIKKDEFNLNWIKNEKPNLPPAVIDSLNVYLFGQIDPIWDAETGELLNGNN